MDVKEFSEYFVKKIKIQYPKINFILNGGIDSLDKAKQLSNESITKTF